MNTAQKIAERFHWDGACLTNGHGENIDEVAEDLATTITMTGSTTVYEFHDGSKLLLNDHWYLDNNTALRSAR